MLKTLLNNKKPHIFHLSFTVAITLLIFKKSEIINSCFAKQCSLIPKKSVLLSQLTLLTKNSLANCYFSKKDILQIIRNLDAHKMHGYDISIYLLKLCGDSICLKCYISLEWKKLLFFLFMRKAINKLLKTIVQFHFHRFVKNTWTLTLWRCIKFFSENNIATFILSNQSWFRPGDSCISHLLSVNHEISSAFDKGTKFVKNFLISPKLLTKYGIMDWFLNCIKIVVAVRLIIF